MMIKMLNIFKKKNKVPYHIHGHIHNPYRNEMVNGTKEISSYMYEYIELK